MVTLSGLSVGFSDERIRGDDTPDQERTHDFDANGSVSVVSYKVSRGVGE